MRIEHQDQDRLVIALRPTGLIILCVGMFAVFFVIGFGLNSFLPAVIGLLGFPGAQTLDDLPQVPGMTFVGLASFVPLGVAVAFLRTRRLEFDRPAGRLTILTKGLFGQKQMSYPLSAILGAVQLTNRAQDGRVAHRAALKVSMAKGVVPLTPYFTSGNGPELTVATINAWLDGARTPDAQAAGDPA